MQNNPTAASNAGVAGKFILSGANTWKAGTTTGVSAAIRVSHIDLMVGSLKAHEAGLNDALNGHVTDTGAWTGGLAATKILPGSTIHGNFDEIVSADAATWAILYYA